MHLMMDQHKLFRSLSRREYRKIWAREVPVIKNLPLVLWKYDNIQYIKLD
jgi:hypothetical protein